MPECVGGQHQMVSLGDGSQEKITHICTKCHVGYYEYPIVHFASSGTVHAAPPSFKEFGPDGSGQVSPETMAFFERRWKRSVQSSLDRGARFPEEPTPVNRLAQAARVLSWLGILFLPFALIGAICGHIALGQISDGDSESRDEALTAITVGWIIVGLMTLIVIYISSQG